MTAPTRELTEQIAAAIRAGGFPHVAAQSFGVSRREFHHWRKRGGAKDSDDAHRRFARAIDLAVGQARLRAEIEVFKDQPRIWLQHGPGRETAKDPGWTTAVKPTAKARNERNAMLMPEAMAVCHSLLKMFADDGPIRERIAGIFGQAFTSASH